jgi:hypothetical protein
VPARNTPRRGARSRKRRKRAAQAAGVEAPASAAPAAAEASHADAPAARPRRKANAPRGARQAPRVSESALYSPGGVGERPRAAWHPVPLSELLILAGAVGAAIGFSRHGTSGPPLTLAGLGAVLLGTLEFTLREHLSGFRSHTVIVAVLGVVAFHSVVVLTVAAFTSTPRVLNIALVAIDVGLFGVLFKVLRARFLDARQERVFQGRR